MAFRKGLEPLTRSLAYHYSFHYLFEFVVWTMPSSVLDALRLVSTPSSLQRLGSALGF